MARDPVLIHAHNAVDAAKRYGVPASVLLGVLKVEGGTDANGRPVAPGDGAGPPSYGQFTYGTGKSLGIHYGDSKSEVDGVARYLLQLGYKQDPNNAIGAYNGGPGNPQASYAAKVDAAAKGYSPFDHVSGVADTRGSATSSAPAPSGAPDTTSSTSSPLSPAQHSTLVGFGVSSALVLAAVVAIAAGVMRVAKSGTPAT